MEVTDQELRFKSAVGHQNCSSLWNQALRFTCKRLASSDDDGYIRDARVPASVFDRAAPVGIGSGRSLTATCCLQAQAAAPQAESIQSPFWVVFVRSGPTGPKHSFSSSPIRWSLASRRIPPVLEMAVPTAPTGRPKVTEEIRGLIRQMKRENPTWGAPRIHGELLALGSEIPNLRVTVSATPETHSGGN